MQTKITNMSNGGNTNYAEGLWQARDQLNSIPQTNRSSLRVVVFFSDGRPNTLAATYPLNGNRTCVGGITASSTTATPSGYYAFDKQNTTLTGNCDSLSGNKAPTQMPAYYNAHNASDTEFLIVGSKPNTVTSATNGNNLARNVYNAATNVPLAMASAMRDAGMYIFTLGLDGNGGFDADLLRNMANTADAPQYNSKQPSGIYCYAATINDLRPCFAKLASEILRISK